MTTDTDKPATAPAPSAEQAADFAALQASADGAPMAPGETAPVEKPAVDVAGEIAGLITMVVVTLGPAFPSLKEIYTQETTAAAAGAIAGVCEKYGWLQGGMMGEWGPEIGCLVVVGPLALATVAGVKGDLARRAKPKAPEQISGLDLDASKGRPAGAQGVGTGEVSFGAPVPA